MTMEDAFFTSRRKIETLIKIQSALATRSGRFDA
jgi:hypothetical protein